MPNGDEHLPIIKVPSDASYEARNVFVRYQSVFSAVGAIVATCAFLGPITIGFRDQVRDNRIGLGQLTHDFAQYRAEQHDQALREETDARKTNDGLLALIAKVDLLVNMSAKSK